LEKAFQRVGCDNSHFFVRFVSFFASCSIAGTLTRRPEGES
jgi:hypothetical protein